MGNHFERVRKLAVRLTEISSVNGTSGERDIVAFLDEHVRVSNTFGRGDIKLFSIPCIDDSVGRSVLVAHRPGRSNQGVLLFGHTDTVGTSDYGPLEALACRSQELTRKVADGALGADAQARARSGRWLFGRGLLDMKAGVAATLVAFQAIAESQPDGHLLWAATPDEEVGSRGVHALTSWLSAYLESAGVTLRAAINADFTGPVDRAVDWPWYQGSIGKVLLGVHVQGWPSHVGEPDVGLDPNAVVSEVTRRIVYSKDYQETVGDECTPMPVSLRQRDDKPFYDVQTALSAGAFYNVLYMRDGPGDLFERFRRTVRSAVGDVYERHPGKNALPPTAVVSFDEVWAGLDQGQRAEILWRTTTIADDRERARSMAAQAAMFWTSGMVAVVYFANGLIPAVRTGEAGRPDWEHIVNAVRRDLGTSITLRHYYPYISDLSFVASSADWDDVVFRGNYPIYRAHNGTQSMLTDNIAMIGPWGIGAHRADESIEMERTFHMLPLALQAACQQILK